jgi:hypothetical protein
LKGLVIDEPWIGLILEGKKTREMRKTGCSHRGQIALIRKGSGQVVGVADVVDSLPSIETKAAYAAAESKHGIPPDRQTRAYEDGWRTPWVLANARHLPSLVPYSHPPGAVIWVNLDEAVSAAVLGLGNTAEVEPLSANYDTNSLSESRQGTAPAGSTRAVTVTGGNVRNNHLYLPLDFFPDDAIGGSNKASIAPKEITAVFEPGLTIQTDIDRSKRILRNRSAIPDFFARACIGEGDTVRITRTGSHTFHFAKA